MQLKIGIAGPMSGPRRSYGDQIKATVARHRHRFQVTYGDDRAEPFAARAVAEDFVARGVHAVIGHFNSECARVAGGIYRRHDIPLLLPASTAPGLADALGAFRLCSDEPSQIDAMVDWFEGSPHETGHLWHDSSVYGRRLAQAAQWQMSLRALPPRCGFVVGPVFLFGTHLRVAETINALISCGAQGPFILCDDCSIDEFKDLVGDADRAEILIARPYPDFFAALRDGLDLIGQLDPALPLLAQLRAHRAFTDGESPSAGFALAPLAPAEPAAEPILAPCQ